MDVKKIFHMKGGHGDTSYSRNSSLQKKGSEMVKQVTMDTLDELYQATTPETLSIADLGCSSGPNSLSIIRNLYRTVENAYTKALIYGGATKSPPQVSVFLNDLPSNDFNSVLRALPELYEEIGGTEEEIGSGLDSGSDREGQIRPSLFVAASPGSFYGRLFHPSYLHFVYSSYSLHWLSKVPSDIYDENGKSMNKGCIYICENSPPAVILAYARQFQEDFSRFLRLRSQELVIGGKMVLVFLGRDGPNQVDRGNSFMWQLLAQSFTLLISQLIRGKMILTQMSPQAHVREAAAGMGLSVRHYKTAYLDKRVCEIFQDACEELNSSVLGKMTLTQITPPDHIREAAADMGLSVRKYKKTYLDKGMCEVFRKGYEECTTRRREKNRKHCSFYLTCRETYKCDKFEKKYKNHKNKNKSRSVDSDENPTGASSWFFL